MTTPAQLDEAAADSRGRRGRRPDHRRAAQVQHRGAGAGRPRDVQPQHPAQAAARRTPPGVYWFGVHALGEGPDGRDEAADGRARTFLPLVPPARAGQQPDGRGDPAAPPARLHRRGLGRRPRQLDQDPLPGRSAPLAGRLRGQLRRPHRDLGRRPRAHRRRTPTGGRQPAPIAGAQPARPARTTARTRRPTTRLRAPPRPSSPPRPRRRSRESAAGSPLDLDELDPVVQAAAQAAQAWLARLGEAMRPEDQVMSLPYGDVDVAAAAEHDPKLYQRAVARAGTTLPGFDVTTTPVLSSPSGYLTDAGDPGRRTGLDDPAHRRDVRGPGTGRWPTPRATTWSSPRPRAGEGGPGPDSQTSITAMRQRLLSEAAVRFLRGDRAPLTMVVPHDWNPSDGSGAFFSGLDASWLDLTSVQAVSQAATPTSVVGATLRYPKWQEAAELDQPNFDSADELIRSGVALQNLLTLNNVVSGTRHRPGPRHGVVLRAHQAHREPRLRRRIPGVDREPARAGARRGSPRGHAVQLERAVPGDGQQRARPAGDRHDRRAWPTTGSPSTAQPGSRSRPTAGSPCCSRRAPTRTASTR